MAQHWLIRETPASFIFGKLISNLFLFISNRSNLKIHFVISPVQ